MNIAIIQFCLSRGEFVCMLLKLNVRARKKSVLKSKVKRNRKNVIKNYAYIPITYEVFN